MRRRERTNTMIIKHFGSLGSKTYVCNLCTHLIYFTCISNEQVLVPIFGDAEMSQLGALCIQAMVSKLHSNYHLKPFCRLSPCGCIWRCRWVTIATLPSVCACLLTSGTGLCQKRMVTLQNLSAPTRKADLSEWLQAVSHSIVSMKTLIGTSPAERFSLAGGFPSHINQWHINCAVLCCGKPFFQQSLEQQANSYQWLIT